VLERKVHNSLSQRGRVRVGVNNISNLSSPPPSPPTGRGVFVQARTISAIVILTALSSHKYLRSIVIDFIISLSGDGRNPDGFKKLFFLDAGSSPA
jgi:hypothetical protein